jgi:molybdate transport system substrate-binding protein
MQRTWHRTFHIQGAWPAVVASVGLLGGLTALLAWNIDSPGDAATEPLVIYCAAGIKAPVATVAQEYQQSAGVPIQLQYGGSQTLLANMQLSGGGDLYLPADDSYIQLAREKGLLAEVLALASQVPVLGVPKGNPKQLRSLEDLLKGDVKLAQANPDAAAIGKRTREVLQQTGQWEVLKRRTTVFKPTVTDVASDIKLGTVDAGIIWDSTVGQFPELDMVHVPQFDGCSSDISIAVLRASRQPTAALRFARYLAARDKGLPEFGRYGFKSVLGDRWEDTPELHLLAGAMLRPAIEETITAFEKREGIRVIRVYNGCGILVAQMKAGERPDAYFACDQSFLSQVHDLFVDAQDVSSNRLVILVHKGNPHGIRSLHDLGKPGLKVGIGHEKQCALGVLTQQTFREGGLQRMVMKNVAVQSPTGDFLVNQLRAGSLDAVVAYLSNATGAADELDAIKIEGIPCAVAVQPIAAGKETKYPNLTARLLDALRSETSRQRFEANGFQWQAAAKK